MYVHYYVLYKYIYIYIYQYVYDNMNTLILVNILYWMINIVKIYCSMHHMTVLFRWIPTFVWRTAACWPKACLTKKTVVVLGERQNSNAFMHDFHSQTHGTTLFMADSPCTLGRWGVITSQGMTKWPLDTSGIRWFIPGCQGGFSLWWLWRS